MCSFNENALFKKQLHIEYCIFIAFDQRLSHYFSYAESSLPESYAIYFEFWNMAGIFAYNSNCINKRRENGIQLNFFYHRATKTLNNIPKEVVKRSFAIKNTCKLSLQDVRFLLISEFHRVFFIRILE